jgi:hypothetical protein
MWKLECWTYRSTRYKKWGEGQIGVIVAGNLMLKYVSVSPEGIVPTLQSTDNSALYSGRCGSFRVRTIWSSSPADPGGHRCASRSPLTLSTPPSNPILCDDHDNRVAAFREVSDLAKAHGSLFIAQLSHPGRQGGAALNPNPVSASDIQLKIEWGGNKFNPPRALTVPEIKDLVKHWGEVAYLCYQAGFDGVQIHCGTTT